MTQSASLKQWRRRRTGRQPREAMRLHDGDHLARGRGARRLEHGCDLDGMMAVIVDDRDAVPCPRTGEAPLDAAKRLDPAANDVDRGAELVRDGDRGGGVQRVVPPRHRQGEPVDERRLARRAVADQHGKARHAAAHLDVEQAHVGLRVLAVGQDLPVLDPSDELLHRRDGRGTSRRSRRTAGSRQARRRRP